MLIRNEVTGSVGTDEQSLTSADTKNKHVSCSDNTTRALTPVISFILGLAVC